MQVNNTAFALFVLEYIVQLHLKALVQRIWQKCRCIYMPYWKSLHGIGMQIKPNINAVSSFLVSLAYIAVVRLCYRTATVQTDQISYRVRRV